jgi:archaellum component FlaD/FlaE
MITKETLYKQIEKFPEELEIEDLIEKLLFINKIESRIALSSEGITISDEAMDKEIEEWFN